MTVITTYTPVFFGDTLKPDSTNDQKALAVKTTAAISNPATTITWTNPVTNQAGAKPNALFVFGIKNRTSGYVEQCSIATGDISADGLTFSNINRGISLSSTAGVDFTTGYAANKVAHPQDSEMVPVVSSQ